MPQPLLRSVLFFCLLVSSLVPLRADSWVNLTWDESPDPIVAGFNVYWGTASRMYSSKLDVGRSVAVLIPGLQTGKRYFFAITAYDHNRIESNFSAEVTTVIAAEMNLPFWYDFHVPGSLAESATSEVSGSAYWWLASGGRLIIENGTGSTYLGNRPPNDVMRLRYQEQAPEVSDAGFHPQNVFQLFLRKWLTNVSEEIYVLKKRDNLTNAANHAAWNGISLLGRYRDDDNYYFAGIRADGNMAIRKKVNGLYETLLQKKVLPGIYGQALVPSLIPAHVWMGLKMSVVDTDAGYPKIALFMDMGRTGTWTLVGEVVDDPLLYGPPVGEKGMFGIRSDCADLVFDDFRINVTSLTSGETRTTSSAIMPDPAFEYTQSRIVLSQLDSRGKPLLILFGMVGRPYTLERSSDLRSWREVTTITIQSEDGFFHRDETASGDSCFYRMIEK